MMESRLKKLITRKRVVYITVKNRDYIRTRQLEKILKEYTASFEIYSSEKGNPLSRMQDLRKRVRDICFEQFDVVILGFLPQLLLGRVERCISLKNRYYSDKIDHSRKILIIAEMFLSIYDTVVQDRKLIWKYGLISALCRRLDRRVLDGAELILTDTMADADFFAQEFKADRNKMEVLYLEAPSYVSSTQEASEIPKTVLYFGTGLPLQGTDIVAKAYQILHKQDENSGIMAEDNLKLIYIGGISHMSRRQRCFIKRGAVEYHKWLPESELLSMIKDAGICLAGHFNASIDKADRTIPGKAFIYEALHKKMILGDTRANHEFFTQDENHIFVDRGSAEALAKCIRRSL